MILGPAVSTSFFSIHLCIREWETVVVWCSLRGSKEHPPGQDGSKVKGTILNLQLRFQDWRRSCLDVIRANAGHALSRSGTSADLHTS